MLNTCYLEVGGQVLMDVWQKAVMVYPRVTGFHWGSLDFMGYIEGTRGEAKWVKSKGAQADSGFHEVKTFMNIAPHPYVGVQSIPDDAAGHPSRKSIF